MLLKYVMNYVKHTITWTKPKITFACDQEIDGVLPPPVRASKAIPKWFKKIKPHMPGLSFEEPGTIKKCIPVLDALSQGYIIPLWADLFVKVDYLYTFYDAEDNILMQAFAETPENHIGEKPSENYGEIVKFEKSDKLTIYLNFPEHAKIKGSNEPLLGQHVWSQVGDLCDLKKYAFGQDLFKFHNPWIIETSPGWSVKIQNPPNNWENDLNILEGVVDTDNYYNQINFPFVWIGSEQGQWMIPKGTPLIHVVPFKRTEVDLEITTIDAKKLKTTSNKLRSRFHDNYKHEFWSKRNQPPK